MLSPSFTMHYTLVSNDGVAIEFSAEQLEFCDYAKNIFTDYDGSWMMDVDDTLPVPPMNGVELRAFHTFLRIRAEEGRAPQIHSPAPVITRCPVYMMPHRVQICRFVYLPSLISINNIQTWSPYCTNLSHAYHDLLDNVIPSLVRTVDESEASVMRRWMTFVQFLGCDDLRYLVEARFLWYISEALERHAGALTTRYTFEPDYLEKLVETVRGIIYLDDQDYDMLYMKRLKDYILEFWNMREEIPEYTAYIVRKYLHHRGPPMPEPDWTAEQWVEYRAIMERLYEEAHHMPDIVREIERHPFDDFRNYPVQGRVHGRALNSALDRGRMPMQLIGDGHE